MIEHRSRTNVAYRRVRKLAYDIAQVGKSKVNFMEAGMEIDRKVLTRNSFNL